MKVVLKGKFIALRIYIKIGEISYWQLNSTMKALE